MANEEFPSRPNPGPGSLGARFETPDAGSKLQETISNLGTQAAEAGDGLSTGGGRGPLRWPAGRRTARLAVLAVGSSGSCSALVRRAIVSNRALASALCGGPPAEIAALFSATNHSKRRQGPGRVSAVDLLRGAYACGIGSQVHDRQGG
jgi:hypothetical protein